MHNYWLGIMAAAFVLALGIWLLLVFNADRHPRGRPQESLPHREVIGGEFEARDGGRQLMPIPREPAGAPQDGQRGEPAAARPAGEPAGTRPDGQPAGTRPAVPEQRGPAEADQGMPARPAVPAPGGPPPSGRPARPDRG